MTNYYLPLEPTTFYHVYNRGNNGDNLFYKPGNQVYFLKQLGNFVGTSLDVYAYALLPNHFHLLIKTKGHAGEQKLLRGEQQKPKLMEEFSAILSEGFRRFFLSYSASIKKQEGRTGSLFEKNFKRIQVKNPSHLLRLVNYIHRNPQTHGLIDDFRKWTFSSYASILSDAPTKLCRAGVLSIFGGRDEFIQYHLTNLVVESTDLWLE